MVQAKMQSGDLRHRLRFQAETRADDGFGNSTASWTNVTPVLYGALWPLKGTELIEGGRTIAVATHRLRIRFRRPFSAQWRVRDLFKEVYFSIVTAPIDLYDKHTYLEMLVKETSP